ncbi:MAG: hypothetical protein ABIT08_04110 [Bacteroidia bacterium]
MNKQCWLIILYFVYYNNAKGQSWRDQTYNDYYIVDTANVNGTSFKANKNSLQLVFYPDSIPSAKWLEPKYKREQWKEIATKDGSAGLIIDTTLMVNQWVQTVNASELRVLSLINASDAPQKFYTLYSPPNPNSTFIVRQVKDESGNWRDIEEDKFHSGHSCTKSFIQGMQIFNLVVKKREGDFETEIRFKMLVNKPPDYPTEQFIYSKPFKGRINKLHLK